MRSGSTGGYDDGPLGEELGLTTVGQPFSAGHDEWQAFIQDSEGNSVGLIALQKH